MCCFLSFLNTRRTPGLIAFKNFFHLFDPEVYPCGQYLFKISTIAAFPWSLLYSLSAPWISLSRSTPFEIMGSTESEKMPLESVNSCWSRIRQSSPVYNFFFTDIKVISAKKGSMIAHLPVGPNHINSKHTLHGSVSATIVDWAGGMAIASTGLEQTGFSTDIHVSYVSTAKEGDILTIEGKTSRVGKNMAFTSVTIYKGESTSGDLEELTVVATGTHTKYILRDQEKAKKP